MFAPSLSEVVLEVLLGQEPAQALLAQVPAVLL